MPDRFIALLDLDCFYCQCEQVRLGIDGSTTPVAVFQWGGAIAVNYPARKLNIKRFARFEEMREVAPDLVGIHVEVDKLSIVHPMAAAGGDRDDEDDEDAREIKYEAQYNLTEEERRAALARENGYFPDRAGGKANIERYRYVSGKIFQEMRLFLNERLEGSKYLLEKASIDELYLDLTDYVERQVASSIAPKALEGKVVTIQPPPPSLQRQPQEIDERTFLCASLVSELRQRIKSVLGYTMSAGVGPNKSMAKLAASSAKPDGVAILPRDVDCVSHALKTTAAVDVRGYAGKFGEKLCTAVLKHRGWEGPWEGEEFKAAKKVRLKFHLQISASDNTNEHNRRRP